MPETERWPQMLAKYFLDIPKAAPRKIRLLVIHTPEWIEGATSAEDLGRYFLNPESSKSYHIGIDSNSIVQYVLDSDVAYGCPGVNNDGLQIAIVGFARQTRAEWRDKFSLAALHLAADACAQYCLKYQIPSTHLTNDQLKAGAKGIIGHYQGTAVYKKSDHTDPGSGFPWPKFQGLVQLCMEDRM
jgi:N-acetylmuramoyl-L-alanine amidase-like protein